MASIARKNLFEDIPRFIVAQAGIMFAVSLVTIQTGILNGFTRSTGLLIEQSTADIWVSSKEMLHSEVTLPLPLERLIQARQVPGVAHAEALISRSALWRAPNGRIAPVRMYAFNPEGSLFANWTFLKGDVNALKEPYTFAVEKANRGSLSLKQIGESGSIGALPAKLVGLTQDTQSMASSTYIYTSLETANAYATAGLNSTAKFRVQGDDIEVVNSFEVAPPKDPSTVQPPRKLALSDQITYVLVQAQPGHSLDDLKHALETTLPGTRAYTKEEMTQMTRTYWRQRTGVGFILGLGATVGVIVGIVVVSQILYSSVADHIREFGTLKAMGASDWVIYRVITEQALWMAVLGYLPSMALCWGLGTWTMSAKGIMILITPVTALSIFGITVAMCVGSALFAIQKVTHVDPAIVFKA